MSLEKIKKTIALPILVAFITITSSCSKQLIEWLTQNKKEEKNEIVRNWTEIQKTRMRYYPIIDIEKMEEYANNPSWLIPIAIKIKKESQTIIIPILNAKEKDLKEILKNNWCNPEQIDKVLTFKEQIDKELEAREKALDSLSEYYRCCPYFTDTLSEYANEAPNFYENLFSHTIEQKNCKWADLIENDLTKTELNILKFKKDFFLTVQWLMIYVENPTSRMTRMKLEKKCPNCNEENNNEQDTINQDNDINQNNSINLYPNPATNQIIVEWLDYNAYNYQIFDLQWNPITNPSNYLYPRNWNYSINIENLPPWTYILIMHREDWKIITFKFVKKQN